MLWKVAGHQFELSNRIRFVSTSQVLELINILITFSDPQKHSSVLNIFQMLTSNFCQESPLYISLSHKNK